MLEDAGLPGTGDERAERWIDAIQRAEGREHTWREHAEKAEKIYLARNKRVPFNVLHSNVSVIVPNIINSMPKPDIRPRHDKPDEILKDVSDVIEAALNVQIDDGRLDRVLAKAAQDAYVAGRGIVRVKWEMEPDRLEYHNVPWRDYVEGAATCWRKVPWVAFRHIVSEEEVRRQMGDREDSLSIPLGAQMGTGDQGRPNKDDDYVVWEVWDKTERKVWMIEQRSRMVLNVVENPLDLQGFFPVPEPIQPITATGNREPTCPYEVYRVMAEEVNRTTRRINKLTDSARSFAMSLGLDPKQLEQISKADDGEIVQLPNTEGMMAQGGLGKAIEFWPVRDTAESIVLLQQHRDKTLSSIYEITGISDIIRGSSDPRETAAAQDLKSRFGAQRLSEMQKMMSDTARNAFVISAEILCRHFEPEQLRRMSGIKIKPEVEKILSQPLDHYRIDVETDSTIAGDRRKFLDEFNAFTQGSHQYFSLMMPLIQQMPELAEAAVGPWAAFVRQLRLGREGETALAHMVKVALSGVASQAARQQQQAEQQATETDQQIKMAGIQQQDRNRATADRQKQAALQVDADKHAASEETKRLGIKVQAAIGSGELGIKEMQVQNQADATEENARQADMSDNRERSKTNLEMQDRSISRSHDSGEKSKDRSAAKDEAERNRRAQSAEKGKDRDAAAQKGDG